MKRMVLLVSFLSLMISFLPGCCRYINWGRRSFYQGETPETSCASLVRRYIRSVNVYSQFSTAAIFDALWLSDDVRTAYARVRDRRFCKKEEQREAFLWRQVEENNHYITFYVLSLYDNPLGNPNDEWTVALSIGSQLLEPFEIKTVDLPSEYRAFLARELSRFKVVYQVAFDAHDAQGKRFIDESVSKISLRFKSPNKCVALSWRIDSEGQVVHSFCGSPAEPYEMVDGPLP